LGGFDRAELSAGRLTALQLLSPVGGL